MYARSSPPAVGAGESRRVSEEVLEYIEEFLKEKRFGLLTLHIRNGIITHTTEEVTKIFESTKKETVMR